MWKKSLLWYTQVALGAATSVLVLSTIRVFYYVAIDRSTQMSPAMFIVFAPLIALPFVFGAVFIEFIMGRFLTNLNRAWPWMIGASYTGILLGLFENWMVVFCLLINPIAVRMLIGRYKHSHLSR